MSLKLDYGPTSNAGEILLSEPGAWATYKLVMNGCMQTLCLSLFLLAKVVVEFQFEAVLGLPAAGRENPTYGILEREEETCYMDWRLFDTKLETADTSEVTVLNNARLLSTRRPSW